MWDSYDNKADFFWVNFGLLLFATLLMFALLKKLNTVMKRKRNKLMKNKQTIEQIQDFKGKYPKQLWYLFFSEMWERFCFYGMRGMLVVFMVNHLAMDEKTANLQYGATQAWVYAFTFIGGLFADKILGLRKSLLGWNSNDFRQYYFGY